MSITKNKATRFTPTGTTADVKFRLTQTNIVNIDEKPNVSLGTVLKGTLGDTPGEVDKYHTSLGMADIQEHFTTAEKTAAKTFLKAVERVAALKIEDLANEPQDDSDVF